MSQSDVERFVEDLKSNEGLRNELSEHASGVGSVVKFAQDKGYDINAEETAAYISGVAGRDLSDADLDSLAGGKGGSTTTTSTVTTTVEATAIATTATAVAEVEAVIVLT